LDKPIKILVVDDESDIVEYLRAILEEEGYSVISASNGEEGLIKIKDEGPNLVISDLIMPSMDGFQLLSAIRKEEPPLSKIPVLMLTSAGRTYKKGEYAEDIAVDYDADDYLDKPIVPDRLLFKVKKLLFRHHNI
jgi:DNA-binding response OmpR family regulator